MAVHAQVSVQCPHLLDKILGQVTKWICHELLANVRQVDHFNLMASKQLLLETEFLRAGLAKYAPEEVITLLHESLKGTNEGDIFGPAETKILNEAKESTKVQLLCFR